MTPSNFRTKRSISRGSAMRRVGVPVAVAAVALVAWSAPASAHVTSDGTPVTSGGSGIVRLLVPGESVKAATDGLTVTFPAGVDLRSVRTLPVPGWKATVEHQRNGDNDRISRIVWTVTDPANGFGNTEYREFTFSGGPWPKNVPSVSLPADQHYSDGSTVSWNEVAVDKASKPEHPAPVIALTNAVTTADHDHHDEAAGAAPHTDDEATAATASNSNEWWWRTLSLVSVIVAAASAAGTALLWRRKRVPSS